MVGKSNNSFIKKQKENSRKKKRNDKQKKKLERKVATTNGETDDMIAYVDKFGNITSEPPVEEEENEDDLHNK